MDTAVGHWDKYVFFPDVSEEKRILNERELVILRSESKSELLFNSDHSASWWKLKGSLCKEDRWQQPVGAPWCADIERKPVSKVTERVVGNSVFLRDVIARTLPRKVLWHWCHKKKISSQLGRRPIAMYS